MKLYSGNTYWDKTFKKTLKFNPLEKDIDTDVLIVGGGMSGNLMAYTLANEGKNVVLVDEKKLAEGSSTANTGLLQYSSDVMVSELAERIGEKDAVLFYEMCLNAMDKLKNVSQALSRNTEYELKNSIYYASDEEDKYKLKNEYDYLSAYDFPVEYLDKETLEKTYKINKPGALRTWHDATVNPYKFILALVEYNSKKGVKYFENTSVNLENINPNGVKTRNGYKIKFKNIILATGYTKIYKIIEDKAQINRTYAFCSTPLKYSPWKDQVMMWETKDPYLYFRTTVGNRIIAGGLDEEISVLVDNKNIIFQKTEEIGRQVKKLFPHLDFEIEYRWDALFGNSKDGLPFIGRDPEIPNKYYLLGYEGNGTCYSMAGAEIISDLIDSKSNSYSHIVRVDR